MCVFADDHEHHTSSVEMTVIGGGHREEHKVMVNGGGVRSNKAGSSSSRAVVEDDGDLREMEGQTTEEGNERATRGYCTRCGFVPVSGVVCSDWMEGRMGRCMYDIIWRDKETL